MVGCLECAYACTEDSGHILVFHLVEVLHVEYKSLFLGKSRNGFAQQPLCAVAVKERIAFYGIDQHCLLVIQRDVEAATFALEKCEAFVDGYFVEPSRQACIAAKVFELRPRLDESVLQQVIGIVMALYHPSDLSVQRLGIHGYDAPECRTACLRRPQLHDQLCVV